MRALGRLVLAGAVALLGCGDSPPETTPDGRIQITVSTSGAPQSDEYVITLDGTQPLAVAPNGSATYESVPEGTYLVHLLSLPDNCVVSGAPNHHSVAVDQGETVRVTFSVVCGAPVSGGFQIVVATVGTPADQDGYRLTVTGTPHRFIGVRADERYEGLAPGAYLATLKGVAGFCRVEGGNPQLFTVVPGEVGRLVITVRCGDGRNDPLP